MQVTICSYEFDLGSEGICTGRLVRALLEAGCHVTVVTSPVARTTFKHEHLRYQVVAQEPLRPAKLFFRLAPLLGHIPTRNGYIWSRRVANLQLAQRPDLVYGRAHPFQSVVAAHSLARRNQSPLWTHFSDPMPSPFWEEGEPGYKRTLSGVRQLVRDSEVLTLTTEPAITHQEELLGFKLDTKALVLNHIAPEPSLLPSRCPGTGTIFAYFGSFYGKRNAGALLRGFQQHLRNFPGNRLLFVGTDPQTVLPLAKNLEITAAITLLPRVDDVRLIMADVDVLVATDSFSTAPVFLSTKLVEYLVVNRSVLLISPKESPGAKLLAQFPQTTVLVDSEESFAVSKGLAEAAASSANESDYSRRFALMEAFSARSVAALFLAEAKAREPSKVRVNRREPSGLGSR